ncbi:MAG: thioredoxin domain-containing protein, partial [Planctomycetales bacterium]|nr:thioredoxin domain-containing protein [Planctomycetales bacterium]
MPNRLATESSPYLLQHAENPVDWHPWGEEALNRSKREDRPIFLSIGYSACHWCHVMEHESFQDPHIAAIINSNFIPIKVDREERPDLDQIYMHAVQLMTGRGGWPMSVFLTPELTPFFGGTYWPPKATLGMPGFDHVLHAVIDAWQNRRQLARDQAQALTNRIAAIGNSGPNGSLHSGLLESAANQLLASADQSNGGFGDAPKFPHSLDIQLLFRLHRRFGNADCLQHACLSLDKMAAGGIYDHLAGGFARYSVDDHWLVPHFEKML